MGIVVSIIGLIGMLITGVLNPDAPASWYEFTESLNDFANLLVYIIIIALIQLYILQTTHLTRLGTAS